MLSRLTTSSDSTTQPAVEEVSRGDDREGGDTDGTAPDVLFVVQHPPVYTLGTGSSLEHLRFPVESPPAPLHFTERGGEVTYHGPGQVVLYPVLDLRRYRQDLHWYLRSLEETVIRALHSGFGVQAERQPGLTGVWADGHKLAAVGVRVSRWVTFHGLALNVCTDLQAFDRIVPCGLTLPVGSVEQHLRRAAAAATPCPPHSLSSSSCSVSSTCSSPNHQERPTEASPLGMTSAAPSPRLAWGMAERRQPAAGTTRPPGPLLGSQFGDTGEGLGPRVPGAEVRGGLVADGDLKSASFPTLPNASGPYRPGRSDGEAALLLETAVTHLLLAFSEVFGCQLCSSSRPSAEGRHGHSE